MAKEWFLFFSIVSLPSAGVGVEAVRLAEPVVEEGQPYVTESDSHTKSPRWLLPKNNGSESQ